jgi:microcystin-dependent protein
MSEPFLAEIRIFGFNFPPRNWAVCDGQILPINQNQSLFALLGSTNGGDGRTTFAHPELRGRTANHENNSHPIGQRSGEENVVLSIGQIPSHSHTLLGSNDTADRPSPGGHVPGQTSSAVGAIYSSGTAALDAAPSEAAISPAGGGQGHTNMQPYLTLNFCIALRGLFPSRN